jgi:two-component system nitrogen regulation response regulator GlnG
LLVVDDDPLIHALIQGTFAGPSCSVRVAATAREGLQAFRTEQPDLVLLDIQLPDRSGLELLQQLQEIDGTVPVIVITASGASDLAIQAIKLGSYDYLVKPLDLERVSSLLTRALEMRRMMSVPVALGEEPHRGPGIGKRPADPLVGVCPAMQEVYKAIGRVAPHDVNVLIRGETGTGKELIARAIYQHSRRVGRTFLAINCAAIPEALLESELFGHEKGAFTGADRQHVGKFEQCNGGTLFLDEIGDMPPALQSKILRVLQEQQLQRVGGRETLTTDVRIIAATHRDLETAVAQERFRGDLYYRLNGFTIELPPLRERGGDVRVLIDHLLHRYAQELGKEAPQLAPETLARLTRYPWPGNVRELQNVVRQALLLCTGPVLMVEHLPRAIRQGVSPIVAAVMPHTAEAEGAARPGRQDWDDFVAEGMKQQNPDLYARALEEMERGLITCVLKQTGGHQTRAADLLGITRGSLRNKIRALGIDLAQLGGDEDGD